MAAAEREYCPFQRPLFLLEYTLLIAFAGENTRSLSDLAEVVIGCSEFERFWADAPSDSAEGVIGCSEFERF